VNLLKAQVLAINAIDALTQTPEVKRLLKPLREQPLKFWHYQCPACYLHFWTSRRFDNIDCPDAKCACKWLPHTMDGSFERGVEEVR
jgi:hypothetical protein